MSESESESESESCKHGIHINRKNFEFALKGEISSPVDLLCAHNHSELSEYSS